jgi:hypothetical protein
MTSTDELCIVYENNIPAYRTSDFSDGMEYIKFLRTKWDSTVEHVLRALIFQNICDETVRDEINKTRPELSMQCMKFAKSGFCIENNSYILSKNSEALVECRENLRPDDNLVEGRSNSHRISPNIKRVVSDSTSNNTAMFERFATGSNTQYVSSGINNSSVNPQKPTISEEQRITDHALKAETLLANIKSSNEKDNILTALSDVYGDVEEDAILDDDIKKMKEEFGDVYDDSESDDNSSDDCDLISEEDIDKNNNEQNEKDMEDEIEELEITEDMPDNLKQLIKDRNDLQRDIKMKKLVVDKANEKLNDDLFKKRCEDQDRRREEQRYKEAISILKSDKNIYISIKSKISKGKLEEQHITPFFVHKYHELKFMDEKDLLSLTTNADIDTEYIILQQLQKMFDVYESNHRSETDSKSESKKNKKNVDDMMNDIVDEVEDEFIEMCIEFLEVLENLETPIMSEKTIHNVLNNDPELKKELFNETTNQTIFTEDTNKEQYMANNDSEKRDDDRHNVKQSRSDH